MDRTKLPPFCEMHVFPPLDVPAEKRLYCPAVTTDRGGFAMATADSSEDEARAIELIWASYDRYTIPARVALLRELAAELKPTPPYDIRHRHDVRAGEWAGFDEAERICATLTERADVLAAHEKP